MGIILRRRVGMGDEFLSPCSCLISANGMRKICLSSALWLRQLNLRWRERKKIKERKGSIDNESQFKTAKRSQGLLVAF